MLKFFTESLVYSEILGKGNRSLSYNYYGITNAQIMQRIALLLLFEMVEIHIAFIEKLSLWKWDLCIGKCWMLRKKKSRKLSHIFSKSKISVALKIKFEPRTCATFLIYCFISRHFVKNIVFSCEWKNSIERNFKRHVDEDRCQANLLLKIEHSIAIMYNVTINTIENFIYVFQHNRFTSRD